MTARKIVTGAFLGLFVAPVIAVTVLSAIGASNGKPGAPAPASAAAPNPAAQPVAKADISTTKLPDSNYATTGLLEDRKRGLATESAELADPTKAGTIDPIAIDPYTRSDYPDVVRQWGSLIPKINQERKLAAKIASQDARCDGVDNAQITDGGSRTNRHYMTECNNLTRVYFDGPSLAAKHPALVRTQADMGAQGVLDW